MANLLDEINGPIAEGLDNHVIQKVIPVTVGIGSTIFEICLWIVPIAVAVLIPYLYGLSWAIAAAGIVPGLIWLYIKQKAENYLQQLEQKIQTANSEIENYMEERLMVIKNVSRLVDKAIGLDKDVMKSVAALRSGIQQGEDVNTKYSQIESLAGRLFPQVESYPELMAHQEIADAMQQNLLLQRTITAARTVANSLINRWNCDIFDWPAKQIVAAKNGNTTRIPFATAPEIKQQARSTFF